MPELDPITFGKIFDMFGEEAAQQTYQDVKEGRIRQSTLDKYLFTSETKEEYLQRLKEEYGFL